MPYNEEKYLPFYLEGRNYPKLLKHHLDIDDLVDLILATNSKSLNAVIRESCAEAAKKLETGKVKKAWLAEHAAEIGGVGTLDADGAAAKSYQAWVDGRIDELAYATETGVIDAMNDRFGGESEDEEDDEDEEDGGEDGEDDDE